MFERVVLDLETNGFLDPATLIHCFVLRDLATNSLLSLRGAQADEGIAVLDKAELIYGHNIIKFDRPVLKKLTGYEIPWSKIRDTLPIAAMRYAHAKEMDLASKKLPKKLIGKHSLEAWGYRLGILKGGYGKTADWSTWTPEMQSYCEQDTLVTAVLVRFLQKAGGITAPAIEVEQELSAYLHQQERNGCPFNMSKAVALQGSLAARREVLGEELRRVFGSWVQPGAPGEFKVKRVHEALPEYILDGQKLFRRTKTGKLASSWTISVELEEPPTLTKVKHIAFNPGSRDHISNRLIKLYGWEPKDFTDSGKPKVDEKTIKTLDQTLPGVNLLVEYLMVVKRLGQLAEGDKAWLKYVTSKEPEGGMLTGCVHIHGGVKQTGTVTHRAAHLRPNLGQVPKVGSLHGAECRELFEVPHG